MVDSKVIDADEAKRIMRLDEGHDLDVKRIELRPDNPAQLRTLVPSVSIIFGDAEEYLTTGRIGESGHRFRQF